MNSLIERRVDDATTHAHDPSLTTVSQALPALARHLRRAGLAQIRLEYDGRRDTGRFAALRGFDAQYAEQPVQLPLPLHTALLQFFRALLEERYPEWARGEGACGDFGWHLVSDTLGHVHRARYVGYDITSIDGL